MQIHQLQPKHKSRKGRRVGRGGKRGTYSGKGVKGQKARSGRLFKPAIRELIKRYPKLRGYRFHKADSQLQIINLDVLGKKFEAGQVVSPQILLEKRIIRRIKGRLPKVKILAGGKLTKAFTIENCSVSEKARQIIEKANGTVK